ncbi:MAG: ATP-binding protein [Bacilli bacterium]
MNYIETSSFVDGAERIVLLLALLVVGSFLAEWIHMRAVWREEKREWGVWFTFFLLSLTIVYMEQHYFNGWVLLFSFTPVAVATLYLHIRRLMSLLIAVVIIIFMIHPEHTVLLLAHLLIFLLTLVLIRRRVRLTSVTTKIREVFYCTVAQACVSFMYLFFASERMNLAYRVIHQDYLFFFFYSMSFILAFSFIIIVSNRLHEIRLMYDEARDIQKMNIVTEMAASVVHEVRNPLTVIKGFIQILHQDYEDERRDYLQLALDEIVRTEVLLNDYLSLVRPNDKAYVVTDIAHVVEESCLLMQPYAHMQNVEIRYGDLPTHYVIAEQNLLKQAFINLIKNAIEAVTDRKGVVIVDVMNEHHTVSITITDNGKGMSEEELKRIGQAYYSHKPTGTGLGLRVVEKIVKEHSGHVSFTSHLGKGTTVTMTLPLNETSDL